MRPSTLSLYVLLVAVSPLLDACGETYFCGECVRQPESSRSHDGTIRGYYKGVGAGRGHSIEMYAFVDYGSGRCEVEFDDQTWTATSASMDGPEVSFTGPDFQLHMLVYESEDRVLDAWLDHRFREYPLQVLKERSDHLARVFRGSWCAGDEQGPFNVVADGQRVVGIADIEGFSPIRMYGLERDSGTIELIEPGFFSPYGRGDASGDTASGTVAFQMSSLDRSWSARRTR